VIELKASETVSSNCGKKTATRKSSKNEVTVEDAKDALKLVASSNHDVRDQFFHPVQECKRWGEKVDNIEGVRQDK